MSNEFNFHELKAAERLPSPSGTALAIMQLVQKEDASIQKVAELVKVDPALSGRIISFANSAAFGARRPIANINDATIMMGMQPVRNFALSLSLVSNHRGGHCPGFDYGAYWAQALAMAVAIAAITARERTVTPEEAFTLGLLSDIGRLALATAWSDIYGECLNSAQGSELLNLERERFAVDHKELTLLLLQDWGFPGIFLDALKLSLEPPAEENSRTTRLARQLAFARLLSRYCIGDDQYRTSLLPGLQQEAGAHGLENEVLTSFIDEIIQQWHDWGKQIEIKTDVAKIFAVDQHEQNHTLPGLDILLVDDDPIMLARLSKQLATAGHRVETCRDGESALKHVIEHHPQLVITDWRMKPMDGLTLCKALRSSDIGKNLYLIMLTATESEDSLVEAFDAGIDDFVTKPVSLRVLLARIRAGQRIVLLQQEVEREKQDIQRFSAELAVANRRLGMMANTDILTGLPNRRYALTRLEQEWDTAQRYKRPLSVLMLDLDHFKSVNDTLGHDAGDVVLAHAAKIMKAAARASDIACRLGGEEFLVIATNTDGATAVLLAERIRSAIQTNQPKDIGLLRPITVSIGVAGSVGSKPGWQELIKLADQALYKVKAGNRNAVQLASI
ncbi:MAG: diguanylate cyclase [Methylococcaceae bacterium]|jgi:diguanylate cyclase (GGDEF)-like protein|nr:diguanylate cyclase [Methylococcaceae bacterium]MDZ4157464.1 diguanylate cyclase [Methylococcales bacterium]MDP2393192.1 diguanylate cyclase [Methylococcaceae bacterium]MDP3019600.1 diguanylate cyclase [Methylococcaceae bacterium]MDP3388978.1 diguanylate cyclase [Methylococcaceae bacterium]